MYSTSRLFLFCIVLIPGFSFWSPASFASAVSDMHVVVVSPFPYSEDGVPQNVKDEMALGVDLPKEIADYFRTVKAFKRVSLLKSDSILEREADMFLHGEILYVQGGNGAARYFGGIGGAGRSSMLVGIKVFDARGQLLHEGRVTQAGTKATNVVTAWSNKKNLTSAMKALPPKILPVAIGGDLETPEGVIRAVESGNALAIRAAAKSSHTNALFNDRNVTDAMEGLVLQAIKSSNEDGYFIDGIAWCLINMGESRDNKYTESLVKVIESGAHNKIKKHARNALKSISNANI